MYAFKSYFYPNPQQQSQNKRNTTIIVDDSPTQSPPPEQIQEQSHRSLLDPRTWSRRTLIIAVALVVAVLVVAIVPAVVLTRNKSHGYPNYYKLNYQLKDTFAGDTFFDNFNYFDDTDPTQGFVDYVSKALATKENLTHSTSSSATIQVDSVTKNATSGRDSIRLVSKNAYNGGLFIFDVAHVPYGCGTWPAIWLTALSGWPNTGEIDVMESVNQATTGNQMTLHTSQGCKMDGFRNQTGQSLEADCWVGPSSSDSCGVTGSSNSAGQAFNAIGGGVYAMEWRSEGIRMWFFERSKIPSDITSPDPSVWPLPVADFPNTNCNIGAHFKDLHIITNIALCGVWAGAEAIYNEQNYCPGSCTGFVASNNTAFVQAYFTYNSFKIYSAM